MSNFLKIYISVIILISCVFVGYAYVSAALPDYNLQEVLKQEQSGSYTDCPDFRSPGESSYDVEDYNYLTIKDHCTGLIWARMDLPTYWEKAATFEANPAINPGYTWQEAVDGCANIKPEGMFRLPTVEELISLIEYKCEATGNCSSRVSEEVFYGMSDLFIGFPFFADGYYWTINDFNEPFHWTDESLPIPGNEDRDYARSVNLLNGKVDSPVFSKTTKLNARCVVDRNPEIIEKKFYLPIWKDDFPPGDGEANPKGVSKGWIKTVYNRKCQIEGDDCKLDDGTTVFKVCGEIDGNGTKICTDNDDCDGLCYKTTCENGYCINDSEIINPVDSFWIYNCEPAAGGPYHLEGSGLCFGEEGEIGGVAAPCYQWTGNFNNGTYTVTCPMVEVCDDGVDNDLDGDIDLADDECLAIDIEVIDNDAPDDNFKVWLAEAGTGSYDYKGEAYGGVGAVININSLKAGDYDLKVVFNWSDSNDGMGTLGVQISGVAGVSQVTVNNITTITTSGALVDTNCNIVGGNYDCDLYLEEFKGANDNLDNTCAAPCIPWPGRDVPGSVIFTINVDEF